MDINSAHAKRHSEQEFSKQFSTYIDSGVGIIHVRTHEIIRAAIAIRRQIIVDGGTVKEWDVVNGFRAYNKDNIQDVLVAGDNNIDIGGAFGSPLDNIKSDTGNKITCYVYVNPHVYMENNPTLMQLMLTYSHVLPSTNTVVVVLTPDMPLPLEDTANILSLTFEPPGLGELKESLTSIIEGVQEDFEDGVSLTEGDIEKVCYVGAGMTKNHFEMYAALAVVEAGRDGKDTVVIDDLIKGVSIGKTDIVNSNDILELYPSTDIKNVGGLENLKGWVSKRRNCYSDDAREFGVEAPKGVVLVGPPGTGKSLVAKAISSELGVPLVRLDFGRVFNSLVGASEQRMRTALKMVESMSPCCTGDTMVELADGTKEPLARLYRERNGTGVMVRSVDPETGMRIDVPMNAVLRKSGKGKGLLRISTESGKSLSVTAAHKVMVRTGQRMSWVEAQYLIVGDDVVEVEEGEDILRSKITAIDTLEEAEYVYDPVCGFPHAYISDGLVSHNCVLFCDELDKGLGGIGGSGDSGTSNRVLGSFLTWLQDCQHPVFVMVTANNVSGLPPEMLRRGRFDAIFSTSMPTAKEREAVLGIHLRIRHRALEDYDEEDVAEIVRITEGYVPAEIESAVKDALVDAFAEGVEMEMAHIKKAVKSMVPLSKAFARQIEEMNEWAKNNATPAGSVDAPVQSTIANSRRVSTRTRKA